ncbi:MAG TPA: DHHA1 domain-containing protein [Nitrososphaeraceae archaeon]|jgi:RecJ-like exonuclease|nr:DHHA1 domain-containing protein [Nitrososphaeraceae archaeon]
MSVTICISHREDVDGISSASLIKSAFDTVSVMLVDYSSLITKLEKIVSLSSTVPPNGLSNAKNNAVDRLFICDLGLSKKNERKFIDIVEKIVSNGCGVIYIDHHDLSKETVHALKTIGVVLVHSVDECTTVQIYNKYKRRLDSNAVFLAAAAALTDYMETKPIASSLVARFDRHFLMLEATALSYMISANQNDDVFLDKIVNALSERKYPHQIEGGFSIVQKYAEKVSEAVKSIERSIVRKDNLAYAQNTIELSSSTVVNFVLGTSERPVAMVYKLKDEIKSYLISIRGSKSCRIHLGRLVNDITLELGGSGGGHDKACGAVVPQEKLGEFIRILDASIR